MYIVIYFFYIPDKDYKLNTRVKLSLQYIWDISLNCHGYWNRKFRLMDSGNGQIQAPP